MRRMKAMRQRLRNLHKGYLKTVAVNATSASYELAGRARHRIKATSQYLSIIAGSLWVSMGDRRLLLKAGDRIRLDAKQAKTVALVPVNHNAAFYKIGD